MSEAKEMEQQIIIDGTPYFVRDIEWEDLPDLNLFGLISMYKEQMEIKAPYVKEAIGRLCLQEPLSVDDAILVEESLILPDEISSKIGMMTFKYIGLFTPFLKAIVVRPSINHIKPRLGIELIRHPIIQKIIRDTFLDLKSLMEEGNKENKNKENVEVKK